jgi:hypothetical protein
MTQQQFLEEIKRLSIAERISLIEAISRTVLEEIEISGEKALASNDDTPEAVTRSERERRMAAVGRLRGVLKTSGEAPSDEQLKDDYTDYLTEKYSCA